MPLKRIRAVSFALARKFLQLLSSGGTPLLALLVVASLGLFAGLAEDVLEGESFGWDGAILRMLRTSNPSVPIGPTWLLHSAQEITALGSASVVLLLSVGAIGFLLIIRKKAEALFVILALGGGNLMTALLKSAVGRPRPDIVPYLTQFSSASFPSGHATVSAITYLTLGAMLMRAQNNNAARRYIMALALIVTILIGSSRVYLGVHWPSDVLAGWCVGSAWAALCWVLAAWYQQSASKGRETGTTG